MRFSIMFALCVLAIAAGFTGCNKPNPAAPATAGKSSSPDAKAPAKAAPVVSTQPSAAQKPAVPPKVNTVDEYQITGDSIVQNGSFEHTGESGFAWWRVDELPPTVKVAAEKTAVAHGGRGLRITLPGDYNLGLRQAVDVEPGASYVLKGYVKARSLAGDARLEVQDVPGGWKVFMAGTESVTGTQDWLPVSAQFTVPKNTKKLNVLLRREAAKGATAKPGDIWFDDVRLCPAKKTEWIAAGDSLLQNGSFEFQGDTGFAWWRVDLLPPTVKVGELKDKAPHLKRCIRFDLPGNVNLGVEQLVDKVQPGGDYILLGRIKAEKAAGMTMLEVQDATGGWKTFDARTPWLSGTRDWTSVQTKLTIPATTKAVKVLLRRETDDSATGSGTVWFDDVRLVPAKKAK